MVIDKCFKKLMLMSDETKETKNTSVAETNQKGQARLGEIPTKGK